MTIETRRREGTTRIAVRDTGSGIAPELVPHLFEPFVVGRPGGVGLGLADRLPDRGAARRPDRGRVGAGPRLRVHGRAAGSGRAAMSDGSTILIVEDHEESRTSLAYALEKRGHLVHQAATGKAALAIARRSQLHAAVLDLRLPDMDGVSVLAAILDHAPGLPVVVVTGYASVDTAVAAMKIGAADFLTKPFKLDDLTRVLDRSIARARPAALVGAAATPIAREMEHFGILGGSSAMREVFERVKRVAPHYRTLLIAGESGTGQGAGRARPARARSGRRAARSWRSTARRSPSSCSRARSSATSAAPSRARTRPRPG